jgi:hypothetical protein
MTLGCVQNIIIEFWFKGLKGEMVWGGGGDAFEALFVQVCQNYM